MTKPVVVGARLEPEGLAQRFGKQSIGLLVIHELMRLVVELHLAIEEQGNVSRMAGDMGIACRIGVTLRLAARLDAVEEITHVERSRIATNFGDCSARGEFRRTEDDLAAVTRFDP